MRRLLLALALLLAAAPDRAAAQEDPSFNLVNRSGRTILELYASSAREPNWGPDRLGADVLPDGRSFAVRLPAAGGCATDIRVTFQDGTPAEERRNVNTCQQREIVIGAPASAQAPPQASGKSEPQQQAQRPTGNPSFWLVNNGRRTVREFYASLATDPNWGPDRLGQGVVPAGERFAVRLPEGDCTYDILLVWQDNQRMERRGVNLCEVTEMPVE
jgi:hypothetical protein